MAKKTPQYKVKKVGDIPPSQDSFMKGWHSVRWYFGLNDFGINAVTKDAGEIPIPEHNETHSGQQELFFVHEGKALFTIDGDEIEAQAGTFVAVQPDAVRSVKALVSPTTIIVMGSTPGRAHEIAGWDK